MKSIKLLAVIAASVCLILIQACTTEKPATKEEAGVGFNEIDSKNLGELGISVLEASNEMEVFDEWALTTYEDVNLMDEEKANRRKRRRARISEVEEPTQQDPTQLPDWITSKQYVTENVDAIKYEPSVLIGAIARTYDDGTFEVYAISKNIKKDGSNPELNWIETPTNYYEETFNQNSRFNSGFLIGKVSVANEKALRVSYKETAYLVLQGDDIDQVKLQEYKNQINSNQDLKPDDFAIVRGIVIVDCTNSSYSKFEGNAEGSFKFLSVDGDMHKEDGVDNNFRMISIDLEKMFAF